VHSAIYRKKLFSIELVHSSDGHRLFLVTDSRPNGQFAKIHLDKIVEILLELKKQTIMAHRVEIKFSFMAMKI
jgi:hypothetical protein